MVFLGEIRMFGGNFAPAGWMFCEGQLLPIAENDTLFNLIGTTYGGDGQETFALPDLRGRIPLHMGTAQTGTTYQLGEQAGVESVTLTTNQIPIHTHGQLCHSGGGVSTSDPANALWAPSDISQYSTAPGAAAMGTPNMFSDFAGGSQPHDNFMPYLCVDFIIALFGEFPSPT